MKVHSSDSKTTTRVYIGKPRYSRRGPVYQVRVDQADGPILVEATLEPALAASRALLATGITGRLELWDSTRPFPRMIADIEKAAELTVREGTNSAPTFVRFKPLALATEALLSAPTRAPSLSLPNSGKAHFAQPVVSAGAVRAEDGQSAEQFSQPFDSPNARDR